jgi:hypothetical protein
MVTLFDIRAALNAEVLTKLYEPTLELQGACGADLMSDVLSAIHIKDMLLLTGLTNQQVVRTAEMAGVPIIVFVRGKVPPPETIALADRRGVVLLRTVCSMFEACGRLYSIGLQSLEVRDTARQEANEELAKLCQPAQD